MKDEDGILFLDIDGTLLFNEYDTEPEVWKVLSEMEGRGIVVSLVTARPFAFCAHILMHLSSQSYHLFDRGSYMANFENFKLSITLPSSYVGKIVQMAHKIPNLRLGLSKEKYFYCNKAYYTEIKGYIKSKYFKKIDEMQNMEGINSIWLRDVPKNSAAEFLESNPKNINIKSHAGKDDLVDIFMNSQVSQKEKFLKILSEANNRKIENSIGIGDSMEDLSFIKLSAVKGCPANAVIEIQKISNYKSTKSYSKGLLDLLHQIFR